jgi:hypothetical protein
MTCKQRGRRRWILNTWQKERRRKCRKSLPRRSSTIRVRADSVRSGQSLLSFNAGERIAEMISSGSEWSDIWKSGITYLNTRKSVVYFVYAPKQPQEACLPQGTMRTKKDTRRHTHVKGAVTVTSHHSSPPWLAPQSRTLYRTLYPRRDYVTLYVDKFNATASRQHAR